MGTNPEKDTLRTFVSSSARSGDRDFEVSSDRNPKTQSATLPLDRRALSEAPNGD